MKYAFFLLLISSSLYAMDSGQQLFETAYQPSMRWNSPEPIPLWPPWPERTEEHEWSSPEVRTESATESPSPLLSAPDYQFTQATGAKAAGTALPPLPCPVSPPPPAPEPTPEELALRAAPEDLEAPSPLPQPSPRKDTRQWHSYMLGYFNHTIGEWHRRVMQQEKQQPAPAPVTHGPIRKQPQNVIQSIAEWNALYQKLLRMQKDNPVFIIFQKNEPEKVNNVS